MVLHPHYLVPRRGFQCRQQVALLRREAGLNTRHYRYYWTKMPRIILRGCYLRMLVRIRGCLFGAATSSTGRRNHTQDQRERSLSPGGESPKTPRREQRRRFSYQSLNLVLHIMGRSLGSREVRPIELVKKNGFATTAGVRCAVVCVR